jgi:hypothetical protein
VRHVAADLPVAADPERLRRRVLGSRTADAAVTERLRHHAMERVIMGQHEGLRA